MSRKKNQRNMKKKKKRSSKLGRHGRVEGFQTSTRFGGYLGSLYPTRDV
jgi:hypothetical protein